MGIHGSKYDLSCKDDYTGVGEVLCKSTGEFSKRECVEKTGIQEIQEDIEMIQEDIVTIQDEVIDFIASSRKKFKTLPPEEISFPRSASNVEKYKAHSTIYSKGTPIHARGALLFTHFY